MRRAHIKQRKVIYLLLSCMRVRDCCFMHVIAGSFSLVQCSYSSFGVHNENGIGQLTSEILYIGTSIKSLHKEYMWNQVIKLLKRDKSILEDAISQFINVITIHNTKSSIEEGITFRSTKPTRFIWLVRQPCSLNGELEWCQAIVRSCIRSRKNSASQPIVTADGTHIFSIKMWKCFLLSMNRQALPL